jgi:hypothetical protein
MIGKAPSHGLRIMPVLGGNIGRNRLGKIDKHLGFSLSVREQQAMTLSSFVATIRV